MPAGNGLFVRRKKSMRNENGFTLVELLIVVTIAVTISSVGLAGYNGFNRRERLKQTASTLKNSLRFAQAKSFSAEKPDTGCTTFVGMRMTFTVSSYSVWHTCNPEGLVGAAQTTSFASGIAFSPVPSDFTFRTLTRDTTLTADAGIALTNGTQLYLLTVSPVGNITDSGMQ